MGQFLPFGAPLGGPLEGRGDLDHLGPSKGRSGFGPSSSPRGTPGGRQRGMSGRPPPPHVLVTNPK
eukprot:3399008-Pyramimonas_sp.AAC.1